MPVNGKGTDKPTSSKAAGGSEKPSEDDKKAGAGENATDAAKIAEQTKSKVFEFLLLEDLDEFEEFPADKPVANAKVTEVLPENMWSEDWVDEELEADFHDALFKEYEKLRKPWNVPAPTGNA